MNGPFPYSSVPIWISNATGSYLAASGVANRVMAGAVEVAANVRTRRFVLSNEQAKHLADVVKGMRTGTTPAMRQTLRGLARRVDVALEAAAIRVRLQTAAMPVKILGEDHWGRWLCSASQLESAGFTLVDDQAWPGDSGPWRNTRIKHPRGCSARVWMYDAVWPELTTIDLYRDERLLLEPVAEPAQGNSAVTGGNVVSLAQWREARSRVAPSNSVTRFDGHQAPDAGPFNRSTKVSALRQQVAGHEELAQHYERRGDVRSTAMHQEYARLFREALFKMGECASGAAQ